MKAAFLLIFAVLSFGPAQAGAEEVPGHELIALVKKLVGGTVTGAASGTSTEGGDCKISYTSHGSGNDETLQLVIAYSSRSQSQPQMEITAKSSYGTHNPEIDPRWVGYIDSASLLQPKSKAYRRAKLSIYHPVDDRKQFWSMSIIETYYLGNELNALNKEQCEISNFN